MNDQILVVGAGGFIGSALVRTLARRGHGVIAVSRRAVDFDGENVERWIGELRTAADFAPWIARSRTVVYLASNSTPGTSAGRPVGEINDNLLPFAGLLQALQDRPQVELLYLSSGGSLYTSTSEGAADESTPLQPRSYHGAAKVAAEYFISALCNQFALRATILRPSNVYGPGQTERPGFGIVPAAFGKLSRNEPLHVWGDGSIVRDYLYIEDLVDLIAAILGRPMPEGVQVLNACSGMGVSLNALFDAIEAVAGRPLPRIYETGRSVDARRIVMSPALAAREYDFSPRTSLRGGLEQTWAWLNSTTR